MSNIIDYVFHANGKTYYEAIPIDYLEFLSQDHSPFFSCYYCVPTINSYHILIAFDADKYGLVCGFNPDGIDPLDFPSLDRVFSLLSSLEIKRTLCIETLVKYTI